MTRNLQQGSTMYTGFRESEHWGSLEKGSFAGSTGDLDYGSGSGLSGVEHGDLQPNSAEKGRLRVWGVGFLGFGAFKV